MKKTMILLSMLAGLAATTNASAQHPMERGAGRPGGSAVNQWRDRVCNDRRADALSGTIKAAASKGHINWGRASHLQDLVKQARFSQQRTCRGQVNSWEAKQIDNRYDRIEARLRDELGGHRRS